MKEMPGEKILKESENALHFFVDSSEVVLKTLAVVGLIVEGAARVRMDDLVKASEKYARRKELEMRYK